MLSENLFLKNRGGAMLLLLVFNLLSFFAYSQECQSPPDCSNIWLELVRKEDNVVTNCQGNNNTNPACGDRFRQMLYTVYLRVKKTVPANDPLLDFNLDYKNLDVIVNLKAPTQPTDLQFSHIDVAGTNLCFNTGVGSKWLNFINNDGDKVIFSATDKRVSISFANISGSGNCGSSGANNTSNFITLTRGSTNGVPPNGDGCPSSIQKCFYAELFTVVVNAYPGELVSLEFDPNGHSYVPKSTSGFCSLAIANTGPHNGLIPVTINNPDTYVGTANSTIEATLLSIEPTSDGGYYFPVALKNTGNTSRTVTYAEFVLKATLTQLSEQFSFLMSSPRVSPDIVDPQTGQITRYLHYVINTPVTLPANQTVVISKIKIGPSVILNQAWAASLDFDGASTKPRLRTIEACTRLKTSGGPLVATAIGDAFCNDPNIKFKVTGISGGCGDLRAKVDIYTTSPPTTMQLRKLEFTLHFEFNSPNITITGVNYPDWPSISCAQFGCFSGQCYTVSSDNKTFHYCFEVPNNAPTAFQLDPSVSMEIVFGNTGKGCITSATLTQAGIGYVNSSSNCIPKIVNFEGFSICANSIKGVVKTELGDEVEAVKMNLAAGDVNTTATDYNYCPAVTCSTPCSVSFDLTDANGAFDFCDVCQTCDHFKLTPEKDDNPSNGVTTYDLVLINKHILGIESFNSPYKMIAADASNTGSITSFDIVELRKLILGIYTKLPNNTSWRFVPKDYSFPNAQNPFQTAFPEYKNCIAPQSSTVEFTAIKIGYVNNTATARPGKRPELPVSWPNMRPVAGDVLTIPITYTGAEPLEALQMGLRFDPAVLQLLSPSLGDLESYGSGNFNLLKAPEGEIRTLWLPMSVDEEKIKPNTILFYLSFKVLETPSDGKLPLWLDDELLDGAAWKTDDTEYALQYSAAVAKRAETNSSATLLQANLHPNPTTGDVMLNVQAPRSDKARIALFDAFGRQLFMREFLLTEGRQDIPLPEVAQLPAGVYLWKLFTPSLKSEGHLVKQ